MTAIFNDSYNIIVRQAQYTYNIPQGDRRLIELVADLDNDIFEATKSYLKNNSIQNIKLVEEDETVYFDDSETIYPFQISKFYAKDDISMRILLENVNDNQE